MESKYTSVYKILRTIFLMGIVYFGIIGVYLNVALPSNGLRSFAFYTIQSNIVCILAALFYIIHLYSTKKLSEKTMGVIQGGVVVCILLTFLVYHFLLSPSGSFDIDVIERGNLYVHYFVPLMILVDYLLFSKKGTFSYKTLWMWTIVPIAYCIFVFVYSSLGGRFNSDSYIVPYFFFDYRVYGVGGVIGWVCLIAIGYLGLSAFLVSFDKLLALIICKVFKKN